MCHTVQIWKRGEGTAGKIGQIAGFRQEVKSIIKGKIEIRCKVCNQRLFDCVSGSFVIEIKCSRCGNTNILRRKNLNAERSDALVLKHGTV